jgi:hypothetical protein
MTKRIHEIWPTWSVAVSLVVLFIGERVYSADETVRMAVAAFTAAGLLAAVGWRAKEMAGAPHESRPVARTMFLSTLGVAVAAGMYAMIPGIFHGDSSASERIRGVLWVLWPIVLVCSLFPLIAIEFATAPVAYIDRYELRRVRGSFQRGLSLALLLSSVFVGNYIANRHELKWDLSAGTKATASDVTRRAIRDLTKPVKVVLFFPRASEVGEVVESYFEPLSKSNPKLTVETVDHALASELAKETKVTENGYVAIIHEKANEKIRIGTNDKTARSNLRRFDQNFLKSFIKVTTSKRVAYFTHGHDERADKMAREEDKRAPVKLLRRQLEAWQFTLKPLGVAEGLSTEIPEDASIVFIMGPEKPFLEAEIDTLKRFIARGGRVFLTLEGEREGEPMSGLLSAYGLSFDKTLLANERTNAPLTKTKADRAFIWSNKYSSHASVSTMTRNEKLATVFFKSGSLAASKDKIDRVKTDMVLTTVPDTFADADGDLDLDQGEKKDSFGLAAAMVMTSTTGKKENEGRLFVVADTDVIADELLGLIQGNILFMADIVYWLQLTQEPVIPTVEEKDVKIVHRKEEDALLFYGTTFGVPALVMLAGMFLIRRRRS